MWQEGAELALGRRHWRLLGGLGGVALLIVTLLVTACSAPQQSVPTGINEGITARDFTLASLDGSEVSLSDYRGSVVLVNFWATWCPPCRAEIPDIEAAYRARASDGFVVLGINAEESLDTVQPFVEDEGMTYPILMDEQGRVASEYRVLGMPMSLLIDRQGVIRARHVGYLSAGQLDQLLAEIEPKEGGE